MGRRGKEHIFDNGVEKKYCGMCKVYKSIEEFHANKCNWDNLTTLCKLCCRIRSRVHRITIKSKQCTGCKLIKPEIEFDQTRFSVDKLRPLCRTCNKTDLSNKKRICYNCFEEKSLDAFPGARSGVVKNHKCFKCIYKRTVQLRNNRIPKPTIEVSSEINDVISSEIPDVVSPQINNIPDELLFLY